ncbi:hypothetical protein KJ742_03780, partial [Patescibacteria group bacterium]|nr:hypothetical protein [Patescibacteria group bacterium]
MIWMVTDSIAQPDIWDQHPSIILQDIGFTMSVALVNMDDYPNDPDGDLDLVVGNYNYPYQWNENGVDDVQQSEIGDYVYIYEWDNGFNSPVSISNSLGKLCIDCIAVADYDKDGNQDIAIGTVVGEGGDGGAFILKHEYPAADWESKFTNEWEDQDAGSYDCHVVRWVDLNKDGYLDLATLGVGGLLRVYLNEEFEGNRQITEGAIEFNFGPYITEMTYQGQIDDPYYDPQEHPVEYNLHGTVMEFGDFDQDGDFDLFLDLPCSNRYGGPRVLKHIDGDFGQNTFQTQINWTFNYPQGEQLGGKESQSCASFGFIGDQR